MKDGAPAVTTQKHESEAPSVRGASHLLCFLHPCKSEKFTITPSCSVSRSCSDKSLLARSSQGSLRHCLNFLLETSQLVLVSVSQSSGQPCWPSSDAACHCEAVWKDELCTFCLDDLVDNGIRDSLRLNRELLESSRVVKRTSEGGLDPDWVDDTVKVSKMRGIDRDHSRRSHSWRIVSESQLLANTLVEGKDTSLCTSVVNV